MALGFGFDLMSQAVRQRPWTPRFLFANGEEGAWYDPSDFATLYQDSAGTTPVTALGQPVGLMQDKSGNGNHASQSTDAARPTVQARVNLLERTEEFDNWLAQGAGTGSAPTVTADATTAPNGTLTADQVEFDLGGGTTSSDRSQLRIGPIDFVAGQDYTLSLWMKSADGNPYNVEIVIISSFAAPAVTSDWQRYSYTLTSPITGTGFVFVRVFGNISGNDANVYLWGAQLEQGSTATTYQRVTTATDYQDIGLPRYLEFDGVDDAMATQSVDFSASDEMTVVMGMSEYVDGAGIELGTNPASVNGSFLMWGDVAGATGLQKGYYSRGTALSKVEETSNTTTFVLAGVSKISSDTAILREDGLVLNTSTTDQGTGNYADHPLYIGARGGTTIELNGRIHQLIVRGKTTSGALLDQTERFVARKTGVTL